MIRLRSEHIADPPFGVWRALDHPACLRSRRARAHGHPMDAIVGRLVIAAQGRYLEDYAVGQKFRSGPLRIDKERIKLFGAEFDPQPFHLNEEAARDTIFGGLAASGWHTAAVTMRLLVESDLKPAGGIVGAGADEFRWPRPVRPGDELRTESEVLEV